MSSIWRVHQETHIARGSELRENVEPTRLTRKLVSSTQELWRGHRRVQAGNFFQSKKQVGVTRRRRWGNVLCLKPSLKKKMNCIKDDPFSWLNSKTILMNKRLKRSQISLNDCYTFTALWNQCVHLIAEYAENIKQFFRRRKTLKNTLPRTSLFCVWHWLQRMLTAAFNSLSVGLWTVRLRRTCRGPAWSPWHWPLV